MADWARIVTTRYTSPVVMRGRVMRTSLWPTAEPTGAPARPDSVGRAQGASTTSCGASSTGAAPRSTVHYGVYRRFSMIAAPLMLPSVYAERNSPSTPTRAPVRGAPPSLVTTGILPVPSSSS